MEYSVFTPHNIPEVTQGTSIAQLIITSLGDFGLQSGDIVLLAHKIVSKAEGRMINLEDVTPSPHALQYARENGKDPQLIQVILDESCEVLTSGANMPMICRHHSGFICANAAVDCSNAKPNHCIALPRDADASAHRIRAELEADLGIRIGVIICDTHGRPFRNGACGVAVGASGVMMAKSYVGLPDRAMRVMRSSVEAVGDELAAAATIIMGQGDEGRPIAVIRGLSNLLGQGSAQDLVRPLERDIFYQALHKQNQPEEE
jgi:coenzyme F420-0:L-glutamate ligase/coenzyme F420-1:gamma-L-glutamate ligase